MGRFVKILLGTNALLLTWNILTATGSFPALIYAQRPPEFNPEGVPYLKVNINPTNVPPAVDINPTDVPPMVNINPRGAVPRVEVARMPEIKLPTSRCENRRNFQTRIGRSISGPLVVTYLNLPQQSTATLVQGNDGQQINLGQAEIATVIFLEPEQRLDFDSDVIYSGCRPE